MNANAKNGVSYNDTHKDDKDSRANVPEMLKVGIWVDHKFRGFRATMENVNFMRYLDLFD